MQQLMSPVGRDNDERGEHGFTLLELVCCIAILAILAAIAVLTIPIGTSRTQLESYAVATAALLKGDREAALRRRTQVTTDINAMTRLIRSGATGRVVRVPDDVVFDALLPAQCAHHIGGSAIHFFPSGMSCGGVIALSHAGIGYEVRVNWLTGGIDIVPSSHS